MISDKNQEREAQKLFDIYTELKEKGEYNEAIQYLKKSADMNAIYAIYTLAYEYDTSNPPNDKEAVRLYKKSILMGDAVSSWNLAKHYKIRNNNRWYLYWLRKASEMGMEEATEELKDQPV